MAELGTPFASNEVRHSTSRALSLALVGLTLSACSMLPGGNDGPESSNPSASASESSGNPEAIGEKIIDPRLENNSEVFVYMQSNMTAKNCKQMGEDLEGSKDKITRWLVAFAVPDKDAEVTAPKLKKECAKVLGSLAGDTPVTLAIGGWNTKQNPESPIKDHKKFLKRWDDIMKDPETFAESTLAAMENVEEQIGAKVTGIDYDFEFPTKGKTDELEKFTVAMREHFPTAHLSMTVDCNFGYPDSFQAKLTKPMVESLNTISVMSYSRFSSGADGTDRSYDAEYNSLSHHLAPNKWSLDCNKHWIKQAGDANKILMGVPAYGMQYKGVQKWGAPYTSRQAVYFKDIPADAKLTTEYDGWLADVDGAPTTFVPAEALSDNLKSLTKDEKDLGGVMVWPARGMNDTFVKAITEYK